MEEITPLEILQRTRARLDKPENWIQGRAAMSKHDLGVFPTSLYACKWCLGGAISCELGKEARSINKPYFFQQLIIGIIADKIGHRSVVRWNDDAERTHKDILELLDQCIAEEKEKENERA